MAGALSRGWQVQRGPQFLGGALAIREERRTAPQALHEPVGAEPPGRHVTRKMHAAHHALAREAGGASQQRVAALGHHVGEQIAHRVREGRVAARIRQVGGDVADARLDAGFDLARPQAPEMPLGGAHVAADVVLDVIG
jgi:hypothetical protein